VLASIMVGMWLVAVDFLFVLDGMPYIMTIGTSLSGDRQRCSIIHMIWPPGYLFLTVFLDA
jgi:hypothetical protein